MTKFVEDKNADALTLKSRMAQFFTHQPHVPLSIEDNILSDEQLEEVVAATRGLSGDDIRELMFAMQSELMSPENDGRLGFASVWQLVEAKVKHRRDSQAAAGVHTLSYLDGDIDLQDVTFV